MADTRIPRATHGRWYTTDVDDVTTGIPDASPATWVATDAEKVAPLIAEEAPAPVDPPPDYEGVPTGIVIDGGIP